MLVGTWLQNLDIYCCRGFKFPSGTAITYRVSFNISMNAEDDDIFYSRSQFLLFTRRVVMLERPKEEDFRRMFAEKTDFNFIK